MNETTQPEKLPLTSMDIATEKREQLRQCLAAAFPEIMAEEKIDLDQLHRVLGEWVEPDRERFGLNWPGKAACMKVIQAPSIGTLKPCPEESVDWDVTENVFVEGDNLEVLKLMQKAYFGKIKMIYIDPPYNTGKEFIYPDKYAETLDTYLEYTGQKDSDGRKFSTNTDTSGRFHSRWLNMMYPRLYLAKTLLSEKGVIFISIDDNELANLKLLCDYVFGEENFVSQLIWNTEGNTDNQLQIKVNHQSILLYCKDKQNIEEAIGYVVDPNTRDDSNLYKGFADNNITKNGVGNPPQIIELPVGFVCQEEKMHLRAENVDEEFFETTRRLKFIPAQIISKYKIDTLPIRIDDMVAEGGKLIRPCRIYGGYANADKLKSYIKGGLQDIEEDDGRIRFYLNRNGCVRYRKDRTRARNILSVLRNVGTTERARTELERKGVLFDYPKPLDLIKYLVRIGAPGNDDLVLDFFAGSATTGQAVMDVANSEAKKTRFILVQLPEPLPPALQVGSGGIQSVADVAVQRLKCAIGNSNQPALTHQPTYGFRVFKLATSCFRAWELNADDQTEKTLLSRIQDHATHLNASASSEEILFELLLKDGFELTVPIERQKIAGSDVYSVADGALLICLDKSLTQEVVDAMADMEPARVICLDSGFQGNDQLKVNAVQTFKARARNRETAIEFRTV
jgi:adenine-specific DNA-methyltransferase